MKVTIMTSLLTKWNMNINTAQIWVFLFLLFFFSGNAQSYSVQVQNTELHNEIIGSDINDLNFIINEYKKAGFPSIDIDTLRSSDEIIYIIVAPSLKFPLKLKILNKESNKIIYSEEVGSISEMDHIKNEIIQSGLSSGFPFIKVAFKEYNKEAGTLEFYQEEGRKIYFDTVKLTNDNNLNKNFLSRYLKVNPKEWFNQETINHIPNRFLHLPGWDFEAIDTILFRLERAEPYLSVKRKQKDYADFFVGLTNNNSGTIISGKASLGLFNLFRSAKVLTFEWQRIGKGSQYLSINYYHPGLFKANIFGSAKLEIIRADSSYNRVLSEFKVFGGTNSGIRYGLGYYFEDNSGLSEGKTDNRFSPTDKVNINGIVFSVEKYEFSTIQKNGVSFFSDVVIGKRKVTDSVDNISGGWIKAFANVSYQRKLSSRFGLNFSLSGVYAPLNDQRINEAFQFGGINEFRGVPQKSLSLEQGVSLQSELRLFLQGPTFLFLHLDAAAFNEFGFEQSFPVSVGPGMSISFKTGKLDLAFSFLLKEPYAFSSNVPLFQVGYRANL
ncbi:hypothetical protein OO013_18860 [Mangrovivirga sp. M17]|uniref:Uncharacterized protein n=1 Tax=Mangrovivirga halotolerans TaxID=2993936 RepID=A0ABT3RW03_9BACT|nr:hypothetical protein [Mangrovivirga halotolerans]MCX2745949.1 hypothetical protein [Mangrovivirga halotolerans]